MLDQIMGLLGLAQAGGAGAQSGRAPLQMQQPQGGADKPVAPSAPGQPGFVNTIAQLSRGLDTIQHPERAMESWARNKLAGPPEKPQDPRASALARLQAANGGEHDPGDRQLFDMMWD